MILKQVWLRYCEPAMGCNWSGEYQLRTDLLGWIDASAACNLKRLCCTTKDNQLEASTKMRRTEFVLRARY